jgi:hypothetical protein
MLQEPQAGYSSTTDNRRASIPIYWLCYRRRHQISIVIEPGASPIHARMRASLADLDEGEFTEGHELDRKSVARQFQRSAKLTI